MPFLDPSLASSYNYDLPHSLIASHPIYPKEKAKLLIYIKLKKQIIHACFGDIFDFLPKDAAVLLNDTKVIKARIFGLKKSGGKVELLLNSPFEQNGFKVYIKGKVKQGTKLYFDEGLSVEVASLNDDGTRIVHFYKNNKKIKTDELFLILNKIGHTPLPPYIKRDDVKEDEYEYQSLFAKNEGAVAAPTASLHFSAKSFEELTKRFETAFITLHVGAGTFKGVESQRLQDHIMHKECFFISNEAQQIIQSNKKILSVGTTVARTVEYFSRTKIPSGECELFLNPFNPPSRVNHLLTNFHLPKSTLIMLVASFIGLKETLRVYQEAVNKNYRFYSYGDAMLIV